MAGAQSARPLPLHPGRLVLDQPDRNLVRIITRQSIRRTFTSVTVLVKQIRDYIDHWTADSKPFVWTATADDILAKVQLAQTNIKETRRQHRKANRT